MTMGLASGVGWGACLGLEAKRVSQGQGASEGNERRGVACTVGAVIEPVVDPFPTWHQYCVGASRQGGSLLGLRIHISRIVPG